MIDERFTHKHDFRYRFTERLQAAQRQAQALPNWESLIEALQNWWEGVLPIAITANQDEVKNDKIAQWLKQQLPLEHKLSYYIITQQITVPDKFLDTLDKFWDISIEHWNETKWDGVGYALGTAIGQSLANTVDINKILIASSLLETQQVGHYAVKQSWLERLSTTIHQKAWLDEIQNAIKELSLNPIDYFLQQDREFAKVYLAKWEQTTELSKTWDESSNSLRVSAPLISILDLIRQLDQTYYLTILDTLSSPILIVQALKNDKIVPDREEILSLLKNAQTILDHHGNWNKCTVAPLLAEIIVSHAHELEQTVEYQLQSSIENADTSQQLREQEIPDWFKQAFQVLVARPDGRMIGIKWLIELIKRYQSEIRQTGEMEWSVTLTAIECLSTSLANADYYLNENSPEVKEQGQLSALLAAILIAEKKTMLSERDDLWQWCQKLLQNRDKGIEKHFYSEKLTQRWIYYQPANLLANSNEPVAQWQQTWNALQDQRNKAMYFHYSENRKTLASSQFLMLTGICTLDWLLDYHQEELAKKLWQVLYDALRETWLTQPYDIYEVWPRLIGFLFAREHIIFKHQATYMTEILPQHLKPLWGNPDLLTLVSLHLNNNDLSPKKLIEASQTIGIDMVANIETNNLWEKATNKFFNTTEEVDTLLNELIAHGK